MSYPAIPVAGSADESPLVALSDYQTITSDIGTSLENFDYFLKDALDQLQKEMRRTFLYAQYTERLYLYPNGTVYGSATPYDVRYAVQAPGQEVPNGQGAGIFQGDGIWVGWFIPLPSLPVWQGVVPPQTDITYWGGWVGSESPLWNTGPFNLPAKMKRIIARVVFYMANPAVLAGLPGGVKSQSVGGVSISGDLSSFMEADPQLRRDIRGWRKPQAMAWDAQTTS